MKKKFQNTKFTQINNQNYTKLLQKKTNQKFLIKHKRKLTNKGLSIIINDFKIIFYCQILLR